MKRTILYEHPRLFGLITRIFLFGGKHGKFLKKIIGVNKTILEPGCGYGRLSDFIDGSCRYRGFDLNEKFVEFARQKKKNVRLGDIFDEANYLNVDIILSCDLLHHVGAGKIKDLLRIWFKYAKEKIIIIEPTFLGLSKTKTINKLIAKIFNYLDSDGINAIDSISWLGKDDYLKQFENFFGLNYPKEYKVKIDVMGKLFFVVYTLNN